MEVLVLVPAPALRREVEGREGAVVAGRVRVEVTGRGRLVVVVVVGRVRVDVVGRVGAAVVVMGAVVMVGGGGGAMVVMGVEVASGAVPVPATGGSVKAFKASSTLTG